MEKNKIEKIPNREQHYFRRGFLSLVPVGVLTLSSMTEAVGTSTNKENHIVIKGRTKSPAHYKFTTSGSLLAGSIKAKGSVNGTTASGTVKKGWLDEYFYEGEITSFTVDGDMVVYVNDEEVNPSQFGSDGNCDATDSLDPSGFIDKDGTDLVLDGTRYRTVGANSFWLSYHWIDSATVDEIIHNANEMGLNTLRVWGFGSGEPYLFQPDPGVYNEEAFKQLDYLIQLASQYDIRLIITLTNYWPDFGGMDQYVSWSETATTRTDFYTDEECIHLYKKYIETVLTRTNKLTNIEYRDDPTIAIWELANEPRYPNPSVEEKEILHEWAHDTSKYIKGIDSNHLVSTGVEGFGYFDDSQYDYAGSWMKNQGYDFVEIHNSPYIDLATMHLYPDHWNLTIDTAEQFISDRKQEATDELNKPMYIGEFGVEVDRDASDYEEQVVTRNNAYETWYETMLATNVNGAMFWQLVSNELLEDSDDFSIVYPDDESTIEVIETGVEQL